MASFEKTAADIYVFDVDPDSDTAAAYVLSFVGQHKDVLEIGAGPGSISRAIVELNKCRVTALEYDAKCLPVLSKFCKRALQGDLNRPGWSAALGGELFDVVVVADVLEHLIDPWKTLAEVTKCLKPTGYVVSSIPNANHAAMMATILNDDVDYRDWGLLDRTHIRFFGVRNIQNLFRQAGLKISDALFVVRTPEMTEFSETWQSTPEELRMALARPAFSQVYQTVVKGCLSSAIDREFVLAENAPPKIRSGTASLLPPPHYSPGQRVTLRRAVGRVLGPKGRRWVKSTLGIS